MSETHLFSGSIPANYDRLLGPCLFEPYALDLKDRLKNDECKNLLELACGTGRVTKHLASILAEGGRIVATDLNGGMIEVAKTKVTDTRVEWQVVDAQELPYEDESFDHVVCQFGVMFFPDKPKAFSEAYRVLTNRGKFIFNTWGSLDNNAWPGLVRDVVKSVLGGETPEFFSKGPYAYHDTNDIESLLKEAGFKSVVVEPVRKMAEPNSKEDYLSGFVDGTPLSAFLEQKDPSLRVVIKQKLDEVLQREFGGNLKSEMLAYVCSGVKQQEAGAFSK